MTPGEWRIARNDFVDETAIALNRALEMVANATSVGEGQFLWTDQLAKKRQVARGMGLFRDITGRDVYAEVTAAKLPLEAMDYRPFGIPIDMTGWRDAPLYPKDAEFRRLARTMAEESAAEINRQGFTEASRGRAGTKTWITMGDSKVRSEHQAMANVSVDNEEPFIVDGYEMMHPRDSDGGAPLSLIARCRCGATFEEGDIRLGKPVPEGDPNLMLESGVPRSASNPFGAWGSDRVTAYKSRGGGAYPSGVDAYTGTQGEGAAWQLNKSLREGKIMGTQPETVRSIDFAFEQARTQGKVTKKGSTFVRGISDWGEVDWTPGTTWTEPAYVSTVPVTERGWQYTVSAFANDGSVGTVISRIQGSQPTTGNGVVMVIRTAEDVPLVQGAASLDEVILPRGGTFKVVGKPSPPMVDKDGRVWPGMIEVEYSLPA